MEPLLERTCIQACLGFGASGLQCFWAQEGSYIDWAGQSAGQGKCLEPSGSYACYPRDPSAQ